MPVIKWKKGNITPPRMALLLLGAAALWSVFAGGGTASGTMAGSTTSSRPLPAIQNSMTLKCTFTSFTMMTGDSKNIKTTTPAASGSLTFTTTNGALAYVAPMGTGKLRLLSTNSASGSMYFEEFTGEHSVVLWAFHSLKDGRVLFSEQLSTNNSGQIEMWTQAGYCEATGGDGMPIRK